MITLFVRNLTNNFSVLSNMTGCYREQWLFSICCAHFSPLLPPLSINRLNCTGNLFFVFFHIRNVRNGGQPAASRSRQFPCAHRTWEGRQPWPSTTYTVSLRKTKMCTLMLCELLWRNKFVCCICKYPYCTSIIYVNKSHQLFLKL